MSESDIWDDNASLSDGEVGVFRTVFFLHTLYA